MSSHATGWGEDAPSPAQLKELFAQIECGRVTKGGFQKFLAENTNQSVDEEVQSNYVHLNGHEVKGVAEQVRILRQLFPWLGAADEKLANQPLPPYAEGWFAIPRWQTFVADRPAVRQTYGVALKRLFAVLRSELNFANHRGDSQLGAERLQQHTRTVEMFQKLGDEQKDHDILVVPAQFGLRHRGRSVRRAREVFVANEFGLGAFAIGIMLLTHPEYLIQRRSLSIDCAGDEFCANCDGEDFSYVPIFICCNDGGAEFSADRCEVAQKNYGSASAFLFQ